MSIPRIIAITLCFSTFPLLSANAQSSCAGSPEEVRSIGAAEGYCSIYERQFAYREKDLEFHDQLIERQKEFIAPQLETYKKYQKDMEALNVSRSNETNTNSQ